MTKKKYKIQPIKIALINDVQIPNDVLERIEGYEVLNDIGVMNPIIGAEVYEVSMLKEIATKSKDNDTNETTRIRVADLWGQINNYKYLMIVK